MMNDSNTEKISVLPKSKNPIFDEREDGFMHSPFIKDYIVCQAIRTGNTAEIDTLIDNYLGSGIIVGLLSNNSLMQMKYIGVTTIALTIHYAILGGLDETDALNFSDECIQHIDTSKTSDDIVNYLKQKVKALAIMVSESKWKSTDSLIVRKCLHYINVHLHDKLEISTIAKECDISRDYLSRLFKAKMNITLHDYILYEKLEASKLYLLNGMNSENISYIFSFCSETHYITCFKRLFNMTPNQFRKSLPPNASLQ